MCSQLYEQVEEGNTATEVVFDEFCEVVARIAQEKLPPEAVAGGSAYDGDEDRNFGHALDSWLSLDFVPRIRNARKRRLAHGGLTHGGNALA